MKPILASIVLAATLAAPALAATKMDGAFPMYPNSHLDARELSIPDSVVARGVPLVLLTSDSVSAVDAWYKSHLPDSCKRITASQGVQYKCSGGSIQIYNHDGTQIAITPASPF